MVNGVFTLLYNTSYLPGTLLLGAIIKDMINNDHNDHPIKLGLLIDKKQFNDHHLSLLRGIYDDIIDTEIIESLLTKLLTEGINRPELVNTFTKINLWNLKHYDKILYLDSDTLPNPQSNLLQLLQLEWPEGKILASPDTGFPDVFNSGVFVIKPNENDYNNLLALVKEQEGVSFDGADQGLLNQYFNNDPDWVSEMINKKSDNDVSNVTMMALNSNWIKLPFLYNVTPNNHYQYAPAYQYFSDQLVFPFNNGMSTTTTTTTLTGDNNPQIDSTKVFNNDNTMGHYGYTAASHFNSQVKLVHFIGPYKPWNYPYTPNHLEWWGLWYKYFSKQVLDQIRHHHPTDSVPKEPIKSKFKKSSLSSPSSAASTSHAHFDVPPSMSQVVSSKHKNPYLLKATKNSLQHKEKESIYGYHPYQIPERSFQESEDYKPTHPIIKKSSNVKSNKTSKEQEMMHQRYSQGVDVDKVTKELEKL